MKPVITKNFLPADQYYSLKKELHDSHFPWYFNDFSVNKGTHHQFTHTFYRDGKITSDFFSLIEPILKIINPKTLLRVKLNLNAQTSSMIETGMHIDVNNDLAVSSVLFFNTCDGYVRFENGSPIYSEDNKLVTFKSNERHTGSTTTNKKRRLVLNLMYNV